jgi:hypothetical protein
MNSNPYSGSQSNNPTAPMTASWRDAATRDAATSFVLCSSIRLFVLLSVCVLTVGCDRSQQLLEKQTAEETTSTHLIQANSSPKNILQRTINRYQGLKSYQDSAFVKLAYKSDGQPTEDRAPMCIAWDKSGQIGLKVYSVTAGPTSSNRWHLSLGKTYPELDSQVLSRVVPDRVDMPWLLSEPLVSESLSAGLGGFPPQLDLLLSPQPLGRLMDEQAVIKQLESQHLEGQLCSVIRLVRIGLTYTFWIEERSGLLRRLELPTQLLPEDILSDPAISDVRLSIELAEVASDAPIDWSRFRVDVAGSKQLVQRFVPPPPQLDTRMLGEQLPAFRLLSPTGSVAYDSTARQDRKASVLMWLADHPACLAAAEQLQSIQQQIKALGIQDGVVEYVPIWAESQPPAGMTFEQLQKQWKLPGNLALDRSAAGRDLFRVQEAPTVAILDGRGKLQFVDVRLNPMLDRALTPLVSRVVEGIDVAAELKQAQAFEQVRFRAELALAASADASLDQRSYSEPYPPQSLQLVELGSCDCESRIVAFSQDSRLAVWALLSDGTLQGFDVGLKPLKKYSTTWVEAKLSNPRLTPSPDGRLFAINLPGAIEVFDTKSQQSIRFSVPQGDSVTDLQWLRLAASQSLRLAAITTGKQVMLLDPENREQLSGSSSSDPLAIVTQSNQGDLDGLVVLSNGKLEPLKLNKADGVSASRVNHKLPEPAKSIGFIPSHGPWHTASSTSVEQRLATGWIAGQELSLFFLDRELQPFWRYRLPYEKAMIGKHQIASAVSPGNSAIVWAVLDANSTIHLLRGDAMWADHFRHHARVNGIALVPTGDRLALVVASQSTIVCYELH